MMKVSNDGYSARVAVDNNTEEVVLELDAGGARVLANLPPRHARRIAIQLLQAADEMDALHEAKVSR